MPAIHDGWRLRISRSVLGWIVAREARRILISRAIVDRTGQAQRWFRLEIDTLISEMHAEADRLRSNAKRSDLPSFGNRLMVEAAIVTAAYDRALRGMGVDPLCSRQIVADCGWNIYRRLLSLVSFPVRLVTRDPGRRIRWTIRILLRFPFNAPGAPGYAVETRIEGGDIMTHFTHCPPQTFVRSLADKTGDLDVLLAFRDSWCLYDWPGADLIAGDGRRGHYRRPHTLSHGDSVCDMCWAARAANADDPRS